MDLGPVRKVAHSQKEGSRGTHELRQSDRMDMC